MSVWQRLSGLWGALFPIAALVIFAVILSLGARGTSADTAPGQTSGASQTTSQSGGTTAGGGSGGAMNSTASGTETAGAGGTAQTTGTAPAATTSGASGATATTQSTGTQGATTQSEGAQGTATQGAGSTASTGTSEDTGAAGSAGSTASGAQNGGAASSQAGTQTAVAAQSSAEGAQVYSANCSSCHGPAGAGVAGAFPPLAGNKAILGSEKYVSDVLLYGLQGQIAVDGQTYNGVMPAWAATLSDAQIAAVLDHVRSSWGNSASAVTEATVKTERATSMTAAQVLSERPQ